MFLLRHGQSLFNLHFTSHRRDPGIADPDLTPLGHAQALQAAEDLAETPLTRVIISPYTRTLQTAEPFLNRPGLKIEILSLVRERNAFSCDIGSPPAALAKRFPQHDFTHLPACWWGEEEESAEDTISRARAFHTHMQHQPDAATTLLVSHWGFIMALTGRSLANGNWLPFNPASPAPDHISWQHTS